MRTGLSDKDRAVGLALSRLVDDHLYWIFVASRWLDGGWFPKIVEGFFHIAPWPIRGFIARQARKEVQQTYHLQGLGRHNQEEQEGFARRDLQALGMRCKAMAFSLLPNPVCMTLPLPVLCQVCSISNPQRG